MFNNLFDHFFSSLLYKALYSRSKYKILTKDLGLSVFEAINYSGHSLLYDEFYVNGTKYFLQDFLYSTNVDSVALTKLHSYYWLSSLKALATRDSAQKAIYLVESWLSKYKFFNKITWQGDILAERIFQLISSLKFMEAEQNVLVVHKIKEEMSLQIFHLILLYKLSRLGLYKINNNLKVIKALITFFLAKEDDDKKNDDNITKIIEFLNSEIKKNILSDGGHISRNPHKALLYLEDLLQIYYMLKNHKRFEIAFIRTSIDRLALFVKSMRHPDGSLAIFNGGYLSDKNKIDYLLSLSNAPAEQSLNLRNSGYVKIVSENAAIFFDIGNKTKNNNSLLSFELSVDNNKLITNLGDKLSNIEGSLFVNDNLARLNNSCLIIKSKDKILSFDLSINSLKIERRSEENWDIIKFIYHGFNNLGISYYRTVYVSRHGYTYILGEDLLSFKKNPTKTIQEAFIRFNLSPQIKAVEFYRKAQMVLFSLEDTEYAFSSADNKINLSKNIYSACEGDSSNTYSMDIYFNLSDTIVKNEWSISKEGEMDKFNLRENKVVRVLDIVDMQNSFLQKDGILSIKNAHSLIELTNNFFKKVPDNFFSSILVKQDTHFSEEYKNSEEAKNFPLHCEYNSKDWQLAVNLELLRNKAKIYKMHKNHFDMWQNIEKKDRSLGLDYKSHIAYQNLFKIMAYHNSKVLYDDVHKFLEFYKDKKLEIYVIGVAADFCLKYAVEGYLQKGYTVYIIQDLTAGINKNILEVITEDMKNSLYLSNLKIINSANIETKT